MPSGKTWTHEWRRWCGWASGEGTRSRPVVVYQAGYGDGLGGEGWVAEEEEEEEEGGVDRRRIACVTLGWNGPPKGECLSRWQGRTWP